MNQVIVKPAADGMPRPRTVRLLLCGRMVDLDLTHKPNHDLAVALGLAFPSSSGPR